MYPLRDLIYKLIWYIYKEYIISSIPSNFIINYMYKELPIIWYMYPYSHKHRNIILCWLLYNM